MNRLHTAAGWLATIARRLTRRISTLLPDAHVYVGVALLANAAAQFAPPWGPAAAWAVLGLGLIWIVRAGSLPQRRT